MSELIVSQEIYSSIKPEILANFLIANDWFQVKKSNEEIYVYAKKDSSSNRQLVWLPLIFEASDYAAMVARVIRTVAKTDNKEIEQVLDDLQTVAVGDVIRVKSYDPLDRHDYSIPLKEGIQLLSRTKQMAVAAASSVITKQPIHPKNASQEVKQFVRKLKLGQTEKGSFLIKLISPIESPNSVPGEFPNFSEALPFSRRAVIELFNGLNALKDAAIFVRNKGEFDFNPFLESVPKGVSANLCEALAPIIEEKENLENIYDWPIELSVTWSYLLRDKSLISAQELLFEPEIFPIIRKAAKEFRTRNPQIIVIRGWVNILERDSRTGPGLIRVNCRVNNQERSVRMKLAPEDYNIAIDAHKKGYIVSVMGTLVISKNLFHLENPENFHLVADEFNPYLGGV